MGFMEIVMLFILAIIVFTTIEMFPPAKDLLWKFVNAFLALLGLKKQ